MSIENEIANWVVLIVDDEPDNLGVPEQLFKFYGADVHMATNGLEGLKNLEKITPTFILLDLSMPEMDGWEMLKRVRADPKTEDIPVLALTAHAMVGDKERALEAGFDSYISKPFMFDTFLDEIQRALRELDQVS
jgi:CheY-like chemotaxis protein